MVLLIEPQLGKNEVIICELINSPTWLFQGLTKPAKITLEHPRNGFPLKGSWGIRVRGSYLFEMIEKIFQ